MYDNFVFYGDIMNSLEALPTEEDKARVALAIIRYGTSGEWDDSNLYCKLILPLVKPGIDNAKGRYKASVEGGRKGGLKGGAPKKELNEEEVNAKKAELGSWKAVASYFGVNEDTLRKRRKEWEAEKKAVEVEIEEVKEEIKEEAPTNSSLEEEFFGSLSSEIDCGTVDSTNLYEKYDL